MPEQKVRPMLNTIVACGQMHCERVAVLVQACEQRQAMAGAYEDS